MYILGICVYHGDCSACLIKDGKIVAAVEEERFRRIKHWAGFPERSIGYCLEKEGLGIEDVELVALGRNPKANMGRKILYLSGHRQSFKKLQDRLRNLRDISNVRNTLRKAFSVDKGVINEKFVNVEHHLAHLASSYLVSPYEDSAILTLDGFGDFVSSASGHGRGSDINMMSKVYYPHSIGLFYTLVTQFLGFNKYGDEYKVMGLASFGEPRFKERFKDVISYTGDGQYRLDLGYFRHHKEGVSMTWNDCEPTLGTIYTDRFIAEFGAPRAYEDELNDFHRDMAASLQAHTEDIIFSMLNDLYKKTKTKRLCLAGGVALNSVANGKIFDHTPFEDIYIQSAAGDAGTSLGAAYYIWNSRLGKQRDFVMESSYWGPEFSGADIERELEAQKLDLESQNCRVELIQSEDELVNETAKRIANGDVVGWFQGRMEWGPRALGNRSIVVDPRRAEMRDVLNARIKRRESFRPFAPSILLEATGEYFEKDYPDPFMIKVYPIRPEKRDVIPAVTHVDGSGRLQTVREQDNPLYYRLIKAFEKLTGVPVVLNTSFNENEPIVCTPKEALDCFLRTRMDVLVMQSYVITRDNGQD